MLNFSYPWSSTRVLNFTELGHWLGRLALISVARCARPSKIIFLADSVSNLLMRPCLSNVSIIDLMVEYFLPRILAMSQADMRWALYRYKISSLSSNDTTWLGSCSYYTFSFLICWLDYEICVLWWRFKSVSTNLRSTLGRGPRFRLICSSLKSLS